MRIQTSAPRFLLVLLATITASAYAQKPAADTQQVLAAPSLEITYDYIHTNGPPGNCGCFNINGGGIAGVYPLRSSAFQVIGKFGAGSASGISAGNLGLTLFTYTVGGRYSPSWKYQRWQPYAELQVGGAHASGNLLTPPNPAGPNTHSAFAGSTGAGLDVMINERLSLKLADVQYLVTTFANGGTDHQNNLRVSAGLVVRFGKHGRKM